MEDSLDLFNQECIKHNNNKYKTIVGSVYVKSIQTPYSAGTNIDLQDLKQFYCVTLTTETKTFTLSVEDDPDLFFNSINDMLKDGFKVNVGSLYMTEVKQDGYTNNPRCVQTWYCCFMEKS
jgi:hypothetical protein